LAKKNMKSSKERLEDNNGWVGKRSKGDSWLEIQDRRKELSTENSAVIEDASRALGVKKTVVGKLFKIMKKMNEDGENELDELTSLLGVIES